MKRSEHQCLATRICQYYEIAAARSKSMTAHHFLDEGVNKSTIYTILSRYLASGTVEYKTPPGRTPVKMSPKESFHQEPQHFCTCGGPKTQHAEVNCVGN